jgi:hypothetical protein
MDEKEARRQRILDLSGILSPCIAGHAIMSVAFDNGATAIQVLKAHYTAGSYQQQAAGYALPTTGHISLHKGEVNAFPWTLSRSVPSPAAGSWELAAGSYQRCSAPFSSQSGAVGRVK